jgi:hypothetical protein
MKPKCSLQEQAHDAQDLGAAAVILVNPENRRRVELLTSEVPHRKRNYDYNIAGVRGGGRGNAGVGGGRQNGYNDEDILNDGNAPVSPHGLDSESAAEKLKMKDRLEILTVFIQNKDFMKNIMKFTVSPDQNGQFDEQSRRILYSASESYNPNSDPSNSPKTLNFILHPGQASHLTFFWLFVLVCLCSINVNIVIFAVNTPCTECLYVQTSKTIKLKAKSWIGAFGSNIVRAVGNFVNTTFNMPWFSPVSTFWFTLGWGALWFSSVFRMGGFYKKLIEEGRTVE